MSGGVSAGTILASVGAAVAGAVVSSALAPKPSSGGGSASSGIGQSASSVLMPTPDDAAAKIAKQKSIAEQIARRGRASTILTGDLGSETLGG